MYFAKYGGELIHDPYSGDRILGDLSISGEVNANGSCSFTIAPSHPCYSKLSLRNLTSPVIVTEDGTIIFDGYISEIETEFDSTKSVTCTGALGYLSDVVLRPYATEPKEDDQEGITYVGTGIDQLFNWYIEQYNAKADSAKCFVVGINQGAVVKEKNYIYASSTSDPTVADEIQNNIIDGVGGYIFTRNENGVRYIDYFAECVDVNAQVIDFGVNLTDYVGTNSTEGMYTVIRPTGKTPDNTEEESQENVKKSPIDISGLADGLEPESGFIKRGDCIYYQPGVDKYGIIEYAWSDSDIDDPVELMNAAIKELKPKTFPAQTITVKAVDLSLYMDGYKPLVPGQLARIRSTPHGFDSYMLLTSMDLDVEDPSNTEYTFGMAYDTLTGKQGKKILELNAQVNHSLDKVAAAQTAANNAAKTATNYLKFDSSGLVVGNHTTTLTGNTQITSSGVNIRNGSTTLATFSANQIELGKNSSSSKIKFFNNAGTVNAFSDSMGGNGLDLVASDGSFVRITPRRFAMDVASGNEGAFDLDFHTEGPVSCVSGTYQNSLGRTVSFNRPMHDVFGKRMFTGTRILNGLGNNYLYVVTRQMLETILGEDYDEYRARCNLAVSNGDWDANNPGIVWNGAVYQGANGGAWIAFANRVINSNERVRVNFTLTWGDNWDDLWWEH